MKNDQVLNKGDNIQCLIDDVWETGTITKVSKDNVTVFMNYIGEERNFGISYLCLHICLGSIKIL